MVSTLWRSTLGEYCTKRLPFTITCQTGVRVPGRSLGQGKGAHLSSWTPACGNNDLSLVLTPTPDPGASAISAVPNTGTCLGSKGHQPESLLGSSSWLLVLTFVSCSGFVFLIIAHLG